MNDTDASILDDIWRGLTKLEREKLPDGRPTREHTTVNVTVVLLDDDNVILGKYCLSDALGILANGDHQDSAANDISTRESAEVWRSIDGQPAGSHAREKREEWEAKVSTLSRDACVRLLASVSIQCYDDETVDCLREAVAQSVRDGDIEECDLTEDFTFTPVRDGPPYDAATATGMYDRDF